MTCTCARGICVQVITRRTFRPISVDEKDLSFWQAEVAPRIRVCQPMNQCTLFVARRKARAPGLPLKRFLSQRRSVGHWYANPQVNTSERQNCWTNLKTAVHHCPFFLQSSCRLSRTRVGLVGLLDLLFLFSRGNDHCTYTQNTSCSDQSQS